MIWVNRNLVRVKLATALETGLALLIALYASSSVFDLVILSWSVMGIIFGPLLILFVMHRSVSEPLALMTLVVGVSITILWRYADLHHVVYEGLPAMIIALLLGYVFSKKRIAKN